MSPRALYRPLAFAEVVTWALLLLGMFLKYVTETTELGVKVFGLMHGVVFIAFCLVTLVIAVDQRWSARTTLLGLASALPPVLTVWFERRAERAGHLSDSWRLADSGSEPAGPAERAVATLLARPATAALVGVAAVAVLTVAALVVGPPMKQG